MATNVLAIPSGHPDRVADVVTACYAQDFIL